MRRRSALALSLGLALSADAMEAEAKNRGGGHCRYPESDRPWPVVLESEDAAAPQLSPAEAKKLVAAFRRAWNRDVLPHDGAPARALAPCMQTDRGYYLRRVSGDAAAVRIAALGSAGKSDHILHGDPASLSKSNWVWEIYFGGWIDTQVPSGSMGAFLTPDEKLLVAVHWPEG
jgi:hypothetical protein